MGEPASEDRSVLRGLLALERDRAQASRLFALLQSGERSFEDLTEEEYKALAGVPLVELVMQRSFAARYSDPERMIALAKTARVLADHLSVRRYGRKLVADFRARAWAELGNAYRVGDKLKAAGEAFSHAVAYAKNGTGSSTLTAHILHRWSVLQGACRDLPEAADILKLIIPYFRQAGKQEALVSALIGLAGVYEDESEPEKAIVVILEALKLIVPDPGSPRLLLLAGFNALAVNLAGVGDFETAWAILQKTRRLYRRSEKLNRYRLSWLEGKIAAGLGKSGLAEAKLNVARLAFRRVPLHYESALVSLDLGLVYARQRRHQELIWLVNDMVKTFRVLGIAREVLASLILLRKSAEKRFSPESLCVLIESIAATLTELAGRDGKAA
jgi:tetratricopeptide (TPR) repeat protein